MTPSDLDFMQQAVRLGRRNLGHTAENPSVGCVIVSGEDSDARIIARGWTAPGGRPHAETRALARAGGQARGATAYVSLEPCAHHGKTPPCADALIDAGIARVVVAATDPDPRVDGAGIARLRAAGIAVETGVALAAAEDGIAGFLNRHRHGRPCVTLKLAVSADGKIAAAPGERTAITGAAAHRYTHLMRARSDAILIGRATAEVDDPQLTVRLPGMADRSPIRVVLDPGLKLRTSSQLVTTATATPVIVFADEAAGADRARGLERSGVRVERHSTGEGGFDLEQVLSTLGDLGINDLLVEGGAHTASAFLSAGLVHRFALFTAPQALGAQAVDALRGAEISRAAADAELTLRESVELGRDRMDLFARER